MTTSTPQLTRAQLHPDFAYPRAGVHAPPGVQDEIVAFHTLPPSAKLTTPLLYFLLGDGTPPYKMDPQDAWYADQPVLGQNCGNCPFSYQRVTTGRYICSQISNPPKRRAAPKGGILPQGWCRLHPEWVKRFGNRSLIEQASRLAVPPPS